MAIPYNFLAIKELQSFAEFNMSNDDLSTLVWLEDESVVPRPTDEEILAKADEIRSRNIRADYKDKRFSEYPPLAEFADAYYWAQQGNTELMDAWVSKVSAVKAKFPKS
jgi:hypothetical protein